MRAITLDEVDTVKAGKILDLGKVSIERSPNLDLIYAQAERFFDSGMQVATLSLQDNHTYGLPDYRNWVPQNLEPIAIESSLLVFGDVEPHTDERLVYGKTHFFLLTLLEGSGVFSLYKSKKKIDSLTLEKGSVVLFNHLLKHDFALHRESKAVAIVQPVIVPRKSMLQKG